MYGSQLTNFNNKMFKKDTKSCYVYVFLQGIDSSIHDDVEKCRHIKRLLNFPQNFVAPSVLIDFSIKIISARIRFGSGSTADSTDRKFTKIKLKFKVFSQQPCLIWNRQKIYSTSMFS